MPSTGGSRAVPTWHDLVDLMIATSCAACTQPGRAVCARCAAVVRTSPVMHRTGDPMLPELAPVYSAGLYQDTLRSLLLANKERGGRLLTPLLGESLGRAITAALEGEAPVRFRAATVALVPIPTSRAARADRGGDTVLAIARAAARTVGGVRRCRVERVLQPTGARVDQAGLDRLARFANLAGAFRARRAAADLVIVVDDIITTGATAAAACHALALAGSPAVAVVTVAATGRRGGRDRAA